MKKIIVFLLISTICYIFLTSCNDEQNQWIRINQLGYRPNDTKVAVFVSYKPAIIKSFRLVDVSTGKTVIEKAVTSNSGSLDPFRSCYRLDFTEIKKEGLYRIQTSNTVSHDFTISNEIYDGTADFLLNYMRQQRCGYNPYIKDSCHTQDGFIIYGQSSDYSHINVSGGWHDAADYLKYVATSANATYQMLFSYSENPGSFSDNHLANGLPGHDGIPDVINESRWGLEWLLKMNPKNREMYNQVADDRDHTGFRLPDNDTANYGRGKERPVYKCTGSSQGLFNYSNRTSGIASTAAKYASAFARGALVFKKYDSEFSRLLLAKAGDAFQYGLENPGVCQTAPGTAPYFYEEENWVDDMELAAAELYSATQKTEYLNYAIEFGRKERVTPWMGADTARHYQWYPFVNMGHPMIASFPGNPEIREEFLACMKEGLENIKQKGSGNPFLIGVPFIWCSNNLVTATLTQCDQYRKLSGDTSFNEVEAAHRDWLFGCNPWGTSMIVGLPHDGDYPENTHSSYVVIGDQVPGGMVDGPVYPSIFNSLKYIYLSREDEYAKFQTSLAVYHDDYADYSTNECTMDGTACLIYYLSSLQSDKTVEKK
jgi:endoglucanase